MIKFFIVIFSFLVFVSCQTVSQDFSKEINVSEEFSKYWFQGKAEISSYDLNQARYGELHKGQATLIFVTEDFSISKQVKLDDPSTSPKDILKVLKLNSVRKFNTGIYPYSTMTSTFTPLNRTDNPNSIKVTNSIQEWCGHTFLQLNLQKNKYKVISKSYFVSEGDQEYSVEKVLLEDEIWNIIRLDPQKLPKGRIQILPGSQTVRFKHIKKMKPLYAEAKLYTINDSTDQYKLVYIDLINRELKIDFKKEFPHEIIGWEEISIGKNSKKLVTRATLKKRKMIDYWNKNSPSDLYLRKELGLD